MCNIHVATILSLYEVMTDKIHIVFYLINTQQVLSTCNSMTGFNCRFYLITLQVLTTGFI